MMELNTLRQFLVVARLEHLSRAADELRIAQPSLSHTIARLESEGGRLASETFLTLTGPLAAFKRAHPSIEVALHWAAEDMALVPSFARHTSIWAPLAAITVDSPDCRRALTLYWGADSHLSTAARLMRTMITNWNWTTGDAPASHSEGLSGR
ncbi:LysR family transcriptional regulator [Nonomuraea sp. NPDC003707]